MRAPERKIVHTYLSERGDVETHSEGDEPDRRLVPGEHVQLQLEHARAARPSVRLLEQRAADPAAAVARGDHQAQVGHMAARAVWIARDREPADDLALVLRDEDGDMHTFQVVSVMPAT